MSEDSTTSVPAGDQPPDRNGPDMVQRFLADVVRSQTLLITVLAVLSALVIGAIIIALSDEGVRQSMGYLFARPSDTLSQAWHTVADAYSALFMGAVGGRSAWSETLVATTPLILTGLAVALPFRAMEFNIGGEGQFLMGAMVGGLVGFALHLPMIIHLPLTLLAGLLAGALWGFIPGILKARTGAHEVIVTIMLNWIAIFFSDWLLTSSLYRRPGRADPISKVLDPSAQLPSFVGGLRAHWGFVVALALAGACWWLIQRSTFGFETKAVGLNPRAARFAGMNPNKVFWMIITIGGALAGVGGVIQVSGIQKFLSPGFSAGLGFDGITVALLGRGNSLGVVLAALLFGALRAGGLRMQAETGTSVDLVVVIQALIIIFVAAPALVRAIYRLKAPSSAEVDENPLTVTTTPGGDA